jgi:hypothetical protein
VAKTAKSPILAHIPFDSEISRLCDAGRIEDVNFDEYADLVETFLESLSAIEQKQASGAKARFPAGCCCEVGGAAGKRGSEVSCLAWRVKVAAMPGCDAGCESGMAHPRLVMNRQ